jgi:hypothetical protein
MEVRNNLREIVYESVNEEYGWGKYGDFKILIRKKDGYVNMTKLCKDGGKELFNWSANDNSKKIIDELSSSLGIPRDDVLTVVVGGKNTDLRGTYVHQDLVPHIASWISPQFAFKVSRIVNNFIVQEYRDELRRKDKQLAEKDQENGRLDKLGKELKEQNAQLMEQNRLLHAKLDLANENIIEVVRGVGRANTSIRGLHQSLGSTARQSVPAEHIHEKDIETFSLYSCGTDEKEDPVYVQCRARPSHLRRREKELQERYNTYRRIVQITPVPNARALASEFERRIQERGAAFDLRRQEIRLPRDGEFDEARMIALAQEVFEERVLPVEEAAEKYNQVEMEVSEEGKISVAEEAEEATYEDRVAELMRETMVALKGIAREFPKDKEAGGWSGKNKTDLIHWILRRRGISA